MLFKPQKLWLWGRKCHFSNRMPAFFSKIRVLSRNCWDCHFSLAQCGFFSWRNFLTWPGTFYANSYAGNSLSSGSCQCLKWLFDQSSSNDNQSYGHELDTRQMDSKTQISRLLIRPYFQQRNIFKLRLLTSDFNILNRHFKLNLLYRTRGHVNFLSLLLALHKNVLQ